MSQEELEKIPTLMSIPSEGFFIHTFETFKTANFFIKLPSSNARGRLEKFLISIITEINSALDLTIAKDFLEHFSHDFINLEDAYKGLDIESKGYKGDIEILNQIKNLFNSFFNTIKPIIDTLEISEHNLKERVKELTCLYGLSEFLDDPHNSVEDILLKTLKVIPPAWQYPKNTCVKIIYNDKEYMTEGFRDTPWTQMIVKEILGNILSIQVNYLEDNDFLKEEEALLNDIGNRLKIRLEHNEKEQRIIDNEEKYRTITSSAKDAIIQINDEGSILYWNEAAEYIFGYKIEEIIGKNFHDLIAPKQYYDAYKKGLAHFKTTGEGAAIGQTLELTAKTKENKVIPISISISGVKIKDKWNAIAIIRDITEQQEAKQKLKESEEMWRSLTEYSSDNIMTVDLNYKILFINHNFFGVTREELIGKSLYFYIPEKFHEEAKECFMSVLDTHQPNLYFTDHIGTDGAKYFYEARVGPVMAEGKIVGFTISGSDITERKKAEEDLRASEETYKTLSKNIPGMVYRGKPDWSTEIITNSEIISGYSVEEFNSQEINWLEIIHSDDKNKVLNDSAKIINSTMKLIQEYRIIAKDGSTRWVEDYKTSFFNKDGYLKGIDGVVYDITSRKKAERKIKEQNDFLINVLESLQYPFYVININDYTIELANSFAIPEKLSEVLTCYALTHKSENPCKGDHVCPIEEVKKTKKSVIVEHIHDDGKGNSRLFEVHGYPILDQNGNVIKLIEFSFDITERKKVEQKLELAYLLWNSLLENSDDHILILDKNEIIQNINKTIPPQTPDEVIGKSIYEYILKEHHEVLRETFRKVYKNGTPYSYKMALDMSKINPNIGIYWINTKIVPIIDNKEISGFILIASNITKTKKVE